MSSAEIWKEFPLDKNYIVSSRGRVFSLLSQKLMKWQIHKSRSRRYIRVNTKNKKRMVHKMVAITFLGKSPYKDGKVDHLDGNTLNPTLSNLEWTTNGENIRRSHEQDRVIINGEEINLRGLR